MKAANSGATNHNTNDVRQGGTPPNIELVVPPQSAISTSSAHGGCSPIDMMQAHEDGAIERAPSSVNGDLFANLKALDAHIAKSSVGGGLTAQQSQVNSAAGQELPSSTENKQAEAAALSGAKGLALNNFVNTDLYLSPPDSSHAAASVRVGVRVKPTKAADVCVLVENQSSSRASSKTSLVEQNLSKSSADDTSVGGVRRVPPNPNLTHTTRRMLRVISPVTHNTP